MVNGLVVAGGKLWWEQRGGCHHTQKHDDLRDGIVLPLHGSGGHMNLHICYDDTELYTHMVPMSTSWF